MVAETSFVAKEEDSKGWILSVQDDSGGITSTMRPERPGVGTTIVDVLAHQPDAVVNRQHEVSYTVLSIAHRAPKLPSVPNLMSGFEFLKDRLAFA